MKLYRLENLTTLSLITIVIGICIFFCSSIQPIEQPYCEKCVRMEKSIRNILIDVEIHDPDYVMDVLCETDDWMILEDLIGPINPPVIKDSTYRRLRLVFPDLPAQQAIPDK